MKKPLFRHTILFLSAVLAAAPFADAQEKRIAIPEEPPAPLKRKQVYRAKPGPWGNLEYYVTDLKPPESLVDYLLWHTDQTEWIFPGLLPEQCKERLVSIGFTEEELTWVDTPKGWIQAGGKTTLFPPHPFVENLTPEQRTKVADVLRVWDENQIYHHPIVVVNNKPEEWFTGRGISAETTALAVKCCYPRGNQTVFSDIPLLMDRIKSTKEERDFTRLLAKEPTLVLRLRLGEGTDVEQVSEYWSAGYKRKDVLSILEAVTENDDVEMLDVSHLLPPLARKLLYTYPALEEGAAGEFPDCHWTSMNFFNYSPQKKFLKTESLFPEIKEKFTAVERPLQFGDVIVIWKKDTQKVLHSAVYIADDTVFTKNGKNLSRPWVFTQFGTMIAQYLLDGDLSIRFYRRN